MCGHRSTIDYLLTKGADVNLANKKGTVQRPPKTLTELPQIFKHLTAAPQLQPPQLCFLFNKFIIS